jgi:hypothetical protein
MLCGSSPIQASSGKITRHRLNRGGDRQANAALYRIVVVRRRWHQPTKDYMARRLTEGKSKKEVIRCLKRYVAREVFAVLNQMARTPSPQPLDIYTSVNDTWVGCIVWSTTPSSAVSASKSISWRSRALNAAIVRAAL